jgi:lauroyl-KDO2-lipid IV(A) myristoyltransferase
LVNWFVLKGRSRYNGTLYAREAGFRPIIKHVRNGSIMFYLPDEDLGRDKSIIAPFFGVDKATIPVLGRLSKACKADVLPCMACYDEASRRYVINILPALQNFPSGDDFDDTLAMNKSLEEAIRLCPSQYFWTMKLFKTRPDGSKNLYSK